MAFGTNEKFLSKKNCVVFIIGLFSFIKIRILGTLGISEILIIGLYMGLINPFSFLENKNVVHLYGMTFLWLLGVFISDQLNGTPIIDSLKGLFNVIFLLLLIPFVYWALYDKPSRMLFFWLGAGISSLMGFYFQKVPSLNLYEAEVWSVYAYYPLCIAISGLLYYNQKRFLSYLFIESFAIWSLWHMSRNVFLCMTIGVCLLIFMTNLKYLEFYDRIRFLKDKCLILILILSFSIFSISYGYEYLASHKILGERAYQKYIMQHNSELGLLSARGDFFQSLELVSKKPIIGYGSYAKANSNMLTYYSLDEKEFSKDEILPGHSYLMGGWVYAGILGLIFWLYILRLIFKFLYVGLVYDLKLMGINILLICMMLWNIFFSPFSDRLNFLFFIMSLIIQTQYSKEYAK